MSNIKTPKKLIEVALPFVDINALQHGRNLFATDILNLSSLVGQTAFAGGEGGDFCADGK